MSFLYEAKTVSVLLSKSGTLLNLPVSVFVQYFTERFKIKTFLPGIEQDTTRVFNIFILILNSEPA
jgi:hypothetical protein